MKHFLCAQNSLKAFQTFAKLPGCFTIRFFHTPFPHSSLISPDWSCLDNSKLCLTEWSNISWISPDWAFLTLLHSRISLSPLFWITFCYTLLYMLQDMISLVVLMLLIHATFLQISLKWSWDFEYTSCRCECKRGCIVFWIVIFRILRFIKCIWRGKTLQWLWACFLVW